MKILLTGASGFVGSAVVQELLSAGHKVVGLVRSVAAASALAALGAEPCIADLRERQKLSDAISSTDTVIHTAFDHDFSRFADICERDRDAIRFIGQELSGSGRPFVLTSALGILPKGQRVDEETDPLAAGQPGASPRAASEHAAEEVAELKVPVSIIRLPPTVHGAGDHGFIPALIDIARRTHISAYIDEGANTWPAVHRGDAAVLFRLAAEHGRAYARFHAVAEEGIPLRKIASEIGTGIGVPESSIPGEGAQNHFGWFTHFASMDLKASSEWTRKTLGWRPSEPTLHEDFETGVYFGGKSGAGNRP